MNRRHFFLGAAALSALTARRAVAANEKVNLAFVGVGGRGRGLLDTYAQLPEVNIAHLVDADEASLERAAASLKKLGVAQPPTSADMRRAFDLKDVDAVVIATPDHWHTPAALLACEAGKDVYVEKPCSHNIREGRLLVNCARYHGRIVQHGTQSRNRPSTIRAIDYARSGKIGKVLMAKAWNIQLRDDIGHAEDGPVPEGVDYETWLGPAPWIPFNPNRFHYKWHWHWHFGTGDAGNDGAHQMDIARWALGVNYPKTISGMGRKVFFDDDQQTPDTMNVTFDYGDKAMIWEMRIWTPYPMEGVDNGVAIYGSDGQVVIGRWNRKWGFKVLDAKGEQILHDEERENEMSIHAQDFIDSIKSRDLPNADIGIGHLSALHCHLANIVARTGRTLQFDAETETIAGDAAANLHVERRYRRHWGTPSVL
ncbi:MAG: Gfo/Idh/MocA family oxidoreductase [Acidobacteria bacterium]|nr:Gfo/Idh/MocA family oxidoreductase [Acidobacteriota bacterium]MDA1236660.1 Gfo/Idh/MocA family oxidoreductase [Acidobacteriota bacterium]